MGTLTDVKDFLDGLINDLTRLHVTAANWRPGDDGLDTIAGPIIERAQALAASIRAGEEGASAKPADEKAAKAAGGDEPKAKPKAAAKK